MIFTGEGPNFCACGTELPGVAHWHDDFMPWTTCLACGLNYVLEAGQVLIYGDADEYGPDLVGNVEDLARFIERSEQLAESFATGPDAPWATLANPPRMVA